MTLRPHPMFCGVKPPKYSSNQSEVANATISYRKKMDTPDKKSECGVPLWRWSNALNGRPVLAKHLIKDYRVPLTPRSGRLEWGSGGGIFSSSSSISSTSSGWLLGNVSTSLFQSPPLGRSTREYIPKQRADVLHLVMLLPLLFE